MLRQHCCSHGNEKSVIRSVTVLAVHCKYGRHILPQKTWSALFSSMCLLSRRCPKDFHGLFSSEMIWSCYPSSSVHFILLLLRSSSYLMREGALLMSWAMLMSCASLLLSRLFLACHCFSCALSLFSSQVSQFHFKRHACSPFTSIVMISLVNTLGVQFLNFLYQLQALKVFIACVARMPPMCLDAYEVV